MNRRRRPPERSTPSELVRWMERFGDPAGTAEQLTTAAVRALDAALDRPGRDREAAYALLAADGLVTRAVERFAEDAELERKLEELIEILAKGGGGERT